MKHVSIIIPLGHASISHIESTFRILSHVNSILDDLHNSRLFKIQLVGLDIPKNNIESRFTAQPDILIKDVKKTELIIIPSIIGDPKNSIALNQNFIPWIQQQHYNGAEVASFCVGAFLLAATG
ncbi:MAG: AraC family transcriptional regulator, partial [Ginsengibacter sp.]